MKIQIASDLHLEFLQTNWPGERLIAPVPGADVLVLAGDIASGSNAIAMFKDWPVPVIYVVGNHEYYRHTDVILRESLFKEASITGVHFLECNAIEIGMTRFIGCTLWTDYKLSSKLSQQVQMEYAERCLNDHRLIRTESGLFTAQDALELHVSSRTWLEQELAKAFNGKTVVVTHHGPHPGSTHPRYVGDQLNAAFVSDLSEILQGDHAPDLWIHGHVHDGFDYTVGRTRVIANPAGYVLNRQEHVQSSEFRFENKIFARDLILEI